MQYIRYGNTMKTTMNQAFIQMKEVQMSTIIYNSELEFKLCGEGFNIFDIFHWNKVKPEIY